MCEIPRSYRPTRHEPSIRLFRSSGRRQESARWRINGHPTRLLIWSVEEWEDLQDRPPDAQYHPLGFWCALRVE